MKNISIIVALGNHFEIGLNNQLLCYLPNDLKRFKQITLNSTVIMGKKTYLSLPVKPLPKRRNIVLTTDKTIKFEGIETVDSIDEVLSMINLDKENFIMGGASIYRQFLPLVDKLYLTRIHADFEADTWFPEINFEAWKLTDSSTNPVDERHLYAYTFELWERK